MGCDKLEYGTSSHISAAFSVGVNCDKSNENLPAVVAEYEAGQAQTV